MPPLKNYYQVIYINEQGKPTMNAFYDMDMYYVYRGDHWVDIGLHEEQLLGKGPHNLEKDIYMEHIPTRRVVKIINVKMTETQAMKRIGNGGN